MENYFWKWLTSVPLLFLVIAFSSCGLLHRNSNSGGNNQSGAQNVETSFKNLKSGFDGIVNQVLPVPGDPNSIYVVGAFCTYQSYRICGLAKIGTDGTLDQNFATNSPFGGGDPVNLSNYNLTAQVGPDNNIYVFEGPLNNYGVPGNVLGTSLVRITPNGAQDKSFSTGTFASGALGISAIAFSEDGSSIYLAGYLTDPSNQAMSGLLKFALSTGAQDTTFNSETSLTLPSSGGVSSILPLQDKIYVSGSFTTSQGANVARLNLDGSLDNTFPITALPTGFVPRILSIPGDTNDLIFYYLGPLTTPPMAAYKLSTAGVADPNFNPPSGMIALAAESSSSYFAATNTLVNNVRTAELIQFGAEGAINSNAGPFSGLAYASVSNLYNLSVVGSQLYLCGRFNNVGNFPANSLARFSSALAVDQTFNMGSGFNGSIAAMAMANDSLGYQGAIVAGAFNQYNGGSVNSVVLLRHDGTVDSQFKSLTTAKSFTQVLPDGNGNFYIAGNSVSYNGQAASPLIRVTAQGILDNSFQVAEGTVPDKISQLLPLIDGTNRILVAGTTTSPNVSNSIVLLKSDGTVDSSFSSFLGDSAIVMAIALTDQGTRMLVGGNFSVTYSNNTKVSSLVKMDLAGNLDQTFVPVINTGGPVSAIAVADQVKGIFYAGFSPIPLPSGQSFSGQPKMVQRFLDTGALDTTFTFFANAYFDVPLLKVAADGSGRLYVTVTSDGIHFCRVNSDGSNDTTLNSNSALVNALFEPGDGTLWLAGSFAQVLNTVANSIIVINTNATVP